jgi:spore maturation protein CgeB
VKVLLVDLEFDYGIKKRGINTIRSLGYQAAIESLGHKVDNFFYDDYLNDLESLQKKLLAYADRSNPDLIFFMLFKNQFHINTLETLKSKFKTVNWFGDDTWRFDNFTHIYAPHFTTCVTTDKYSIIKYDKLGIKNVILSQWAAINTNFSLEDFKEYKFEVSFIGAQNTYRSWFVKQLAKNKISVNCFGHGWKNGSVSNKEMNDIFRNSKINLNLSNSTSFDVRYLASSIRNLAHTLKSNKNSSQIKARNFEIPFAGGFQLTDYTPSLEDYLQIGKEVACYNSIEDCVTQIDYYLVNDNERENIRNLGQQKAINNHTYQHRFVDIFKELN